MKDIQTNIPKDEDDDQNFISNRSDEQQNQSTKDKRATIYQRLKEELGNVVKKLQNAIRPVTTEIRSLDNEVGGTEIDYKKVDKNNDADVDVWDNQAKTVDEMADKSEKRRAKEGKKLIHVVKNMIRLKGGNKKMGQVDLAEMAEKTDKGDNSFAKKVRTMKEDRSHEGGGIGF